MKTYIRCRDLIDGTGAAPRPDVLLVVDAGRISRIEQYSPELVDQEELFIDLREATVIPGMMDMHCHLLLEGTNIRDQYLTQSSAAKALRGLRNAEKTLRAGFTTIRIPGDLDRNFAHFAVRDAINRGWFEGPRVYAAGCYLSITGGHGDFNEIPGEMSIEAFARIVDSPEEMRKAVRYEIGQGADWIKVFATGGVLSSGDDPALGHFSYEEMKEAVDTATALGKPVAAHAHGARGIYDAVRAGVRSIEHGTMLEPRSIELMAANGTFLVPTCSVVDMLISEANPLGLSPQMVEKGKKATALHRESVAAARRAGIPIAAGTDSGLGPHGENGGELVSLVDYGLTPMEAILAATSTAAKLLGIESQRGTLAPGMCADLVAMPENPLHDIGAVTRVGFVMKDGEVVFDSLSRVEE